MRQGIVYLVGAGPGDHKLISLRGQEYIGQADTIIYDRLVDERLLAYARPDAETIYVGKATGHHSSPQEEINSLLIAKAAAGRTVVRLKGGDPFVFGRGAEEALALCEAGVPFEVVPGISSALAVPAYAGIPVTHRGIASSFAVITGHEDVAKNESSIRWEKLAQSVDTLVFLMAVENLAGISSRLIKYGRSPDTPAALISSGAKPDQKVLVTTLARVAEDARQLGAQPPAVFIVGEVVKLREKIAWFDKRPLFGKTILVTRAREQAGLLTSVLENLGARCLEAPAIKIIPPDSFEAVDQSISDLAGYDWLIFTSVNGVEYFYKRLRHAGHDSRAFGGVKVAAIGALTAARLRESGIIADVVPLEFRAEGIVAALADKIKPGMKVLIPRAAAARDVLPDQLRERGAMVEVVEVYRTVSGEAEGRVLTAQLAAGEIDLVTFTSSSTVTNLLAILGAGGPGLLAGTQIACIGPVTASTCLECGLIPGLIAEEFTIAGLVKAICDYYKEESFC